MYVLLLSSVHVGIYHFGELLNDRSSVQIPFNVPPATTITNINLYINLPYINNYIRRYDENSTIVAQLSVLSSYSDVSVQPVNNTILPVVTLTGPDGSQVLTSL